MDEHRERADFHAKVAKAQGHPSFRFYEGEILEKAAKEEAERRGWLTGDINQTDKWFRAHQREEEDG
jgi:hypothetical protein